MTPQATPYLGAQFSPVTIFGGTGFIGRQIIRELARSGVTIRVACRNPESAYALRPSGMVGQIVPVTCDINDTASLRHALSGAKTVINCIGILFEKGQQRFQKLHADFPGTLARLCQEENIEHLIHISALGIENSKSNYAKTKYEGERNLKNAFPQAIILRPSVVFGAEDNFFNQFATLARYLPVLPLIGAGKTKFQPIFVGDIADAVIKALQTPSAAGHIFELGGPEILTFRSIYERLFEHTKNPRYLMPIPFCLAKVKGAFLQMLPHPLLTIDQVRSLETDSILTQKYKTVSDLGLVPASLDLILPTYLDRFRPGGRFAEKKKA